MRSGVVVGGLALTSRRFALLAGALTETRHVSGRTEASATRGQYLPTLHWWARQGQAPLTISRPRTMFFDGGAILLLSPTTPAVSTHSVVFLPITTPFTTSPSLSFSPHTIA